MNTSEENESKSSICRLCLNYTTEFTYLTTGESTLHSHLSDCLPNINLVLSNKPLVCASCSSTIQQFHTFKQQCTDNETLIRNCYEHNKLKSGFSNTSSVTLEEVLIFRDKCDKVKVEYIENNPEESSDCVEGQSGTSVAKRRKVNKQSASQYSCKVCPKVFSSKQCFLKHEANHANKYQCTECGKLFTKYFSLQQHMNNHNNVKPYKCKFCVKAFNQKGTLNTHLRTHTGEKPFICSTCSKAFSDHSCFRRHCQRHDDDPPTTTATATDTLSSSNPDNLTTTTHSGNTKQATTRRHPCPLCPKQFHIKSELKRHLHFHTGVKEFECVACGRLFGDRSALKRHEFIHTGEKPHACPVCGKGFNRNSNLKIHMKVHNKVE